MSIQLTEEKGGSGYKQRFTLTSSGLTETDFVATRTSCGDSSGIRSALLSSRTSGPPKRGRTMALQVPLKDRQWRWKHRGVSGRSKRNVILERSSRRSLKKTRCYTSPSVLFNSQYYPSIVLQICVSLIAPIPIVSELFFIRNSNTKTVYTDWTRRVDPVILQRLFAFRTVGGFRISLQCAIPNNAHFHRLRWITTNALN
jgi:hypothetical protein